MSNSSAGDMAGPGSMPSGQMTGVPTATMVGMAITEMPRGGMTGGQQLETGTGGELPTVEITGRWHLTLSPTSFQSSP